jgi:putative PLP-dependent aminotransferase (TIGR04422 family)
MTAERFFLWPEPAALTASDFVGSPCPSEEIEATLHTFFPITEPVLFSSARAGLSVVLQQLGLSRADMVWTPGFSSHCVLDAVSRVCTPQPIAADGVAAALIYHQWGHSHQANFPPQVRLIDDLADTFFVPGTSPFVNDSDYALWSLPKVIGTLAGGVVFCRRAEDAAALRAVRATRPMSVLQAFLRWRSKKSELASRYWNGAEAAQGDLIPPLRRQVMRRLREFNRVAHERLAVLRRVSSNLCLVFERQGRLPSNLPIAVPDRWETVWGPNGLVSSGLRFFNAARSSPAARWIRVAPLPVHIDVAVSHLQEILKRLDVGDAFDELQIV